METWFTSDLHLGHIKDFIWGARGFTSMEDHDNFILDWWKTNVTDSDTVVIVGDFLMGPNKPERARQLFNTLPYHEIHYYSGNHCPKINAWGEYDFSVTKVVSEDEEVLEYFRLKNVDGRVFIHPFANQINTVDINGETCTIGHLPYKGSEHKTATIDPREALYPFPVDCGRPRIHGHTHRTEKVSYTSCGTVQVSVGWDCRNGFVNADEIAREICTHSVGV